jgi:hypothetical protein
MNINYHQIAFPKLRYQKIIGVGGNSKRPENSSAIYSYRHTMGNVNITLLLHDPHYRYFVNNQEQFSIPDYFAFLPTSSFPPLFHHPFIHCIFFLSFFHSSFIRSSARWLVRLFLPFSFFQKPVLIIPKFLCCSMYCLFCFVLFIICV